eukprot:6254167-Pyramimonas_sp.AAC.1
MKPELRFVGSLFVLGLPHADATSIKAQVHHSIIKWYNKPQLLQIGLQSHACQRRRAENSRLRRRN